MNFEGIGAQQVIINDETISDKIRKKLLSIIFKKVDNFNRENGVVFQVVQVIVVIKQTKVVTIEEDF